MESFIYPTDAQLDCSKNVRIYIKIYMRSLLLRTHTHTHTPHTNKDWINMQPLDRTDSVNDVF